MRGEGKGMYKIDSSVDKPDIEYLEDRIKRSMDAGIAVNNLDKLYKIVSESKEKALRVIQEEYGIENPNSSQQIINYYVGEVNKDVSRLVRETGIEGISRVDVMYVVYNLLKVGKVEVGVEDLEGYVGIDGGNSLIVGLINEILSNEILRVMYKGGKWVTNKVVMSELALLGYESAIDIMTYRKNKVYLEAINGVKEMIGRDGLVHPIVSLGKTNRINYRSPALMNIPKELVWNMISARGEGNVLISIDIKNQEPWILINMLDIKELKEVLKGGGSLYDNVYKLIYGVECNKQERDELKLAWNALTYGGSKKCIVDICKHIDGEVIYKYFNKIPEYKSYKSRFIALGRAKVQKAETYFKTVLNADELGSKLGRVLMDIGIQGTGSDILALLVKHFDDVVKDGSMDIYYTRHDELIIEVERWYIDKVGIEVVYNRLMDIFEHKVDDWEPFKVKIKELVEDKVFMETLSDSSILDGDI